jgi:hypothetical protein
MKLASVDAKERTLFPVDWLDLEQLAHASSK